MLFEAFQTTNMATGSTEIYFVPLKPFLRGNKDEQEEEKEKTERT